MFSQITVLVTILSLFLNTQWIPYVQSSSTNLRGNSNNTSSIIQRTLYSDDDTSVLCRVTTFDTMYYDEIQNNTSTTEQITCLPIVDEYELEVEFPISLPIEIVEQYPKEIEMGTLLVMISDAVVYDDELFMGTNPQYKVITNTTRYRHLLQRHLQVKSTMTAAVIRISTSDSVPTTTRSQLQSVLFSSTGTNFVTQYNAISFGKLKWTLAAAGVVDIVIPQPISSFASSTALVTAAQKILKSQFSISEVSSLADKILMCLPPGTGNWAASAGVNHWRAQFNNDWCTSLSGTMHELGHTMGLLHAQANGVEYADRTGYMGSGYTSSTFPKKSFNGYNTWKFGWYSDRHLVTYPLTDGSKLVKIASAVDYQKTTSDENIVVNINDQYYLLYNTKKGFNMETEQKQNQVTITEAMSTGTDSRAGLSAGGTKFTVSNYQNSGKTLIVQACQTMTGTNGASIMQVSIGIDKNLCGTTQSSSSGNPVVKDTVSDTDRSAFLIWLDNILNRVRTRVGSN